MSVEALKKAVEIAGGQSALGRAIDRDQKAIWSWINTTQKVPAEDVLKIEKAISGKVSRHDLRPDVYPKPAPLDRIQVIGGKQLNGDIPISGAKNAALKLMCAGLLTSESLHLENMPNALRDIGSQSELLEYLGCTIAREKNLMALRCAELKEYTAPYDIVRKMRASIQVLGPLLARNGKAKVSLPGGCAIGARAVDLHIKALEEMGATITIDEGYINAEAPAGGLQGAKFLFPKVSVGATENMLMAATLAKGTSVIGNAAREPEIVNLGECLIKMGAKISGLGSETITVEGVSHLSGTNHEVVPDRIETGTYIIAAGMTGGKVRLQNARIEHLSALIGHLCQAGMEIEEDGRDIIAWRGGERLKGVDIMTEPHPGFATDLQAQFMAMLSTAEGAAMVTETIFENRFMHVPELCRMGANITVQGNSAIVRGVDKLKGAQVMATDLRASVALVLAGLVAEGETTINRIYHLERGYEDIVGKLSACGADITKI